MLYAERDESGAIVAIRKIVGPETQGQEKISSTDLALFLSGSEAMLPFENLLAHLDTGVIRVLDDLIELLVDKHLILFTDLPAEAREKMYDRKRLRRIMHESQLITDDIV
jgi:hypothetical protein